MNAPSLLRTGNDRVIVFNPGGPFDGWLCEWEAGPFSTLRALRQVDTIPLPPGFDIVAAVRPPVKGEPKPRIPDPAAPPPKPSPRPESPSEPEPQQQGLAL